MRRLRAAALALLFMTFLTGCGLRPPPPSSAVPAQNPGSERTEVLIYGGISAWVQEINSIKSILSSHNITYVEYNDDQMNELTVENLKKFSLVVFAGGDSDLISDNLDPDTKVRLRNAVREDGLNYLGLCAGAWLVMEPNERDDLYGFQFIEGPWLHRPSLHDGKTTFKLTVARFPGGVTRRLLWFGGPITPEIPGGVVARYEDGTPAVTQMKVGKGFVVISGLHPTANKEILESLGLFVREAIAPDLAWTMIEAAIYGKPMQAFIE